MSIRPADGGAPVVEWPSRIPELTTARLRLRATFRADAPALLGILGDPEVTKYLNVSTITTLDEAYAALERLQRRHAARDTIRWGIELVGLGEIIGTVGLLRFDFDHSHGEIGYEISRRFWGRGFATEAAAAVVEYGFTVLALHRIEAGVLPDNAASVRVLQKLGFAEEGLRRDYLTFKGTFHSLRWFSLLETDEVPRPIR